MDNEDGRLEKHTRPFPVFALLPSGSSKSVSEDNWDSVSLHTTNEGITSRKQTWKNNTFNLITHFCDALLTGEIEALSANPALLSFL